TDTSACPYQLYSVVNGIRYYLCWGEPSCASNRNVGTNRNYALVAAPPNPCPTSTAGCIPLDPGGGGYSWPVAPPASPLGRPVVTPAAFGNGSETGDFRLGSNGFNELYDFGLDRYIPSDAPDPVKYPGRDYLDPNAGWSVVGDYQYSDPHWALTQ